MTEREVYLDCALDIGTQMLMCGAEINRVEDSITRILCAGGATQCHVLAITACVAVTVIYEDGESLTRTRRVQDGQINLTRLHRLNALSRALCAHTVSVPQALERMKEIREERAYGEPVMLAAYAGAAAAFCLFFGGSLPDALASGLVGLALRPMLLLCARLPMHKVISSGLCALAGGLMIRLLIELGIGQSFDSVAIGDVMLLIPGLVLTNAIRDLIAGDTITGMLRLCEAGLTAVAVAVGFAGAGGLAL